MTQDLSWLLYPIDKQGFIDHYLEKAPLVVERSERDYFQHLLSLNDVEALLAKHASTTHADISVVHPAHALLAGHYTHMRKLGTVAVQTGLNLPRIKQLFHEDKAFIRIRNMHSIHAATKRLAHAVRDELACVAVDATLHLAPGGGAGTDAGYHTHDLFLLQSFGRQVVQVYEPVVELPLGTQASAPIDVTRLTLAAEAVIDAGGAMYIPRGFVFRLGQTDTLSGTMLLGMYHATWTRLLVDSVYALGKRSDLFRGGFFLPELESKTQAARQEIFYQIKQILLDALPGLEIPRTDAPVPEPVSLTERLSDLKTSTMP